MRAQLICWHQCVAGYNILARHHTAIQSWQFSYLLTAMSGWVQYFSWSPSSHPVMSAQLIFSKQCLAGHNILADHHSAIQSWQLSCLLTAMCGWVQYFRWSPYCHPVMTAQLISSQQCVSGYNILTGHHAAIQSWQLSYLLTAMCGWIQYFSWSPNIHPVMTAQLIYSLTAVCGWVQYFSWSI